MIGDVEEEEEEEDKIVIEFKEEAEDKSRVDHRWVHNVTSRHRK